MAEVTATTVTADLNLQVDRIISKFDKISELVDNFEARLQEVEKRSYHETKSSERTVHLDYPKVRWKGANVRNNGNCSETMVGSRFNKPLRLILIRHGESEGNVDPKTYEVYQDHGLPLTERGIRMARKTGGVLSSHLDDLSRKGLFNKNEDTIGVFVSPYTRTRMTLQGLLDGGFSRYINEDNIWESQYLTEMDWGLFEGDGWQKTEMREMPEFERNRLKRAKHGKFYARCPNGESVKDVVMRVDLFTRRMLRRYTWSGYKCNTFVIVSHGVTIRAFIMRWFDLSPLWYEISTNHPNCSIYEIFQGKQKFIFGGYKEKAEEVSVNMLNNQLLKRAEVKHKYNFRHRGPKLEL